MSIIAYTDFVAEVTIANKSEAVVQENINAFIAKYEPKYLTLLLGVDLYTLYLTGRVTQPILPKWTAFDDLIKPAIVDYVYYWYMRNQFTQTVGTGNVQSKNENSSLSNYGEKLTRAWNEMADISRQTVQLINKDTAVYGAYYQHYYYGYQWPEIFQTINNFGI